MKIYDRDHDKKIEIIKGDSAKFYADVEDYEYQSGDTLQFIVKKNADDATPLISKTFDAFTSPITLTTSETNALDYGTYTYVIRLISGNERTTIVEPSTFEVIRW